MPQPYPCNLSPVSLSSLAVGFCIHPSFFCYLYTYGTFCHTSHSLTDSTPAQLCLCPSQQHSSTIRQLYTPLGSPGPASTPLFHTLFYVLMQLKALRTSSQASCLGFYLSGQTFIMLGGGDPWTSASSAWPLFYPGPHSMEFFQTCEEVVNQLLLNPGPWSCFLPCSLLLESQTPPLNGHYSQCCLWFHALD